MMKTATHAHEIAKRELLKPDRRITAIAYDIGHQSVSQFNRSFLKIVGESPSEFRKLPPAVRAVNIRVRQQS